MKNIAEIDLVILSENHKEGEKVSKFLKSCSKSEECLRIVPKYWICGKENQFEIKDNMLLVIYADSKSEFDKLKGELKHFSKIKHRFLLSDKEEARTWATECPDLALKVFVGMKDDTLSDFRAAIRTSVPSPNISAGVKNY